MGRRKSAPHKINTESLNFGENPSSSSNTGNEDLQIEEVDNEVPRRKKKKPESVATENPILKDFLDNSDFYIPIHPAKSTKRKQTSGNDYFLCEINLTVLEKFFASPLPSDEYLYLYVGECSDASLLYWELASDLSDQKAMFYWSVHCNWSYDALEALRMKSTFRIVFEKLSDDGNSVILRLWLLESSLQKLSYPSQCIRMTPDTHVQAVMKQIYGIIPYSVEYTANERCAAQDLEELYVSVRQMQRNCLDKILIKETNVQHTSLVPLLRPYQSEAVRWMLLRERIHPETNHDTDTLHPLYTKIGTEDGRQVFYNMFGGFFVDEKPLRLQPSSGGILADEMGLGKTVEVLACVLLNPKKTGKDDCNFKKDTLPDGDSTSILEDQNTEQSGVKISSSENRKTSAKVHDIKHFYERSVAPKTYFECICGSLSGTDIDRTQVQCSQCGLWQHAECVNFDVPIEESDVPYRCPHCWVLPSNPPLASKATLIVSPASICYQWQEEIEKHIRDDFLKILVYSGVHNHGFVQPTTLSEYDIVLTTYETLRKELQYVNIPHCNSTSGRRFRFPKRFMALPSPLVAVDWWRICLDEAQMVECTTTKAAEMVSRLSAVHRWCITGTPLQKTIDDLYGLLLFLQEDPYFLKLWWKELLYEPYCHGMKDPLLKVLTQCFWRSSKKDVLDQIGIPPQIESVNLLDFSAMEGHFYARQQEACTQALLDALRPFPDLSVDLKSLDKHTISLILKPLRRLRQACCHPQVVRGQFLSIQKSVMTMEELLASLIKKVKTECEEAHRIIIASLNGLAAIQVIKQDYAEAVALYREVLQSVNEYKEVIKTDRLQRIHTLQNLAEILELCVARESANLTLGSNETDYAKSSTKRSDVQGRLVESKSTDGNESQSSAMCDTISTPVGHTLRDDNLKKEAAELRASYLSKSIKSVEAADKQLEEATEKLKETEAGFKCPKSSPWWTRILSYFNQTPNGHILIEKVREDLMACKTSNATTIVNRFSDLNGLAYVITKQLDELEASRKHLAKCVEKLSRSPSLSEVNDAAECHLRAIGKERPQCIYCKIHEAFNHYEAKLFNFSEDEAIAEPSTKDEALLQNQRRGTWADSEVEKILKTIVSCAKSYGTVDQQIIWDGSHHKKLFTVMKKEFRALRAVWMEIRDFASAIDEVNMATIRYRVRYPDEPKPDAPVSYILENTEVDNTRLRLSSEKVVSQNEFKKKLGQLCYLQNLEKANIGKNGGINPDLCPICQKELGTEWSVLQCGHCFCVECIRILLLNYSRGGQIKSILCPVCRQATTHPNITYVKTKVDAQDMSEKYVVKGSYSSKVVGVVRCVLKIKDEDRNAKVLVFSTWQDVLDIISKAFHENSISFVNLKNSKNFCDNLKRFRYDPEVSCLLLPINSGANGLNLIEATHVILVEPVLNPASELQACGRVHRIGQTKPTVLHRFIINQTIEERIYEFLKPYMPCMDSLEVDDHSMTLQELKSLFTNI